MSRVEAAWLAGFFDGEGSITRYMGGRNKAYECVVLSISNTHLGSLKWTKKITGTGTVYLKCKATKTHKTQYTWRLNSQRNVVDICQQMLPYLVIKRAKINKFLKEWKNL